eukprot:5649982-Pyramimonas_sp.AAC.1
MEICGGEARSSQLAVRRPPRAGAILNDESHQRAANQRIQRHRPLVAVVAPACRPFGRLPEFNCK